MLQSMGSQRVRHHLVTEEQQLQQGTKSHKPQLSFHPVTKDPACLNKDQSSYLLQLRPCRAK